MEPSYTITSVLDQDDRTNEATTDDGFAIEVRYHQENMPYEVWVARITGDGLDEPMEVFGRQDRRIVQGTARWVLDHDEVHLAICTLITRARRHRAVIAAARRHRAHARDKILQPAAEQYMRILPGSGLDPNGAGAKVTALRRRYEACAWWVVQHGVMSRREVMDLAPESIVDDLERHLHPIGAPAPIELDNQGNYFVDMENHHGYLEAPWGIPEVALYLGVGEATVRHYTHKGVSGFPDSFLVGDRPHWYPDEITHWQQQRPGKGGRPPE